MQRQRGRNGVQVYSAKVLEWHEGGGIGGQLSAGAQKKEKEEGHGGEHHRKNKKNDTPQERAHLLIQTNFSRTQGQSCYKSQECPELMGEWLRTGPGTFHCRGPPFPLQAEKNLDNRGSSSDSL